MFSKQRLATLMLLLLALIVLHAEEALSEAEISYGDNSKAGQFIKVNGIRLYYETYGSGPLKYCAIRSSISQRNTRLWWQTAEDMARVSWVQVD